ncbi:MAG: 16S rRNA processing protein RimM [Oscillospiraceae bacterium]|nr:16S rRNA processing protein RimM [Oscillospiraceae bacterium]
MELEFITVGQIVNAHGIRGEIKILPRGIDPDLLCRLKSIYIDGNAHTVTASRVHKGCLLVKLPGIEDMNAALALKNLSVSIRKKDIKLPKGVYFDQELIGLTARNAETGEILGTLDEVMDYPAHKVYAVRGGRDEFLIPAVPAFVEKIDLQTNTIDIHVWEGLGSHEN